MARSFSVNKIFGTGIAHIRTLLRVKMAACGSLICGNTPAAEPTQNLPGSYLQHDTA